MTKNDVSKGQVYLKCWHFRLQWHLLRVLLLLLFLYLWNVHVINGKIRQEFNVLIFLLNINNGPWCCHDSWQMNAMLHVKVNMLSCIVFSLTRREPNY